MLDIQAAARDNVSGELDSYLELSQALTQPATISTPAKSPDFASGEHSTECEGSAADSSEGPS